LGSFVLFLLAKAEGTRDEGDLQTRISRIDANFFNHRWTQIDTDPETRQADGMNRICREEGLTRISRIARIFSTTDGQIDTDPEARQGRADRRDSIYREEGFDANFTNWHEFFQPQMDTD
jgi:hypothetical protein